MEEQKIPMVLIAGPTATGKSELAVSLCRETGGEVISADSVQVYRGMDIGSAKISREEMGGVPHHLIDVLSPDEPFNVTVFQAMASEAVREIRGRGHLPVVCGGTGFYIQALLRNVDFTQAAEDPAVRAQLEAEAGERGAAYMHALLERTDPEAARKIPAGNLRRVIRALEYHALTGEKISAHNEREMAKPSGYNSLLFVLTMNRERLYRRIEQRVDRMLEEGLEEEVRHLADAGLTRQMTSAQALGYKEMLDYLDGALTLKEARDLICLRTRHFAKRQLTWFRREKDAVWLDRDVLSSEEILTIIREHMARAGMLSPGTEG